MKSKLMVLDRDYNWLKHKYKLCEETCELVKGINEKDLANIAEEALDIIQVCIGILDKLQLNGIDISQVFLRHEKKLIDRGLKPKGVIEIEVRNIGRV
ncbi:MazG nucleotide pyrophosphohydrolase domain-containing protein [Clostridium sp. JN-9]|uniref:MazG nucleotide pyrophosphohydrolase domain-containing protein n=1 Tax=Clostridium sp. JN-9 TaxID=2507159 RepID=UPI000FFE25D6|nr:MazG nucleotide pyrophosphohydrolase domain-containing protein [Clostridium sp. JN-9]QAT40859.1 hypothetical protein EQM05_11615 [Clostridium sp. JN-9]